MPIPSDWKKFIPFGLAEPDKPRHYREILQAAWDSRTQLPFAWRILSRGVCDGCSLGPRGLRDDAAPGVHLCISRLRLLRLNTMGALDPHKLSDIDALRRMGNRGLHDMGRVARPLLRKHGENRFRAIPWDDALDRIATAIGSTSAERVGFFLTSKGLTNETYYTFRKLASCLGTNHIDSCARLCHAASVTGLKRTLGVGAMTCSLEDWMGTDLIVLFGTDLANNQPVSLKYLHAARKRGARIVVVNPFREPALEKYWLPSEPASALFGSEIATDFYSVNQGGDIAFILGVIKHLVANDWLDDKFIAEHTHGFEALRSRAESTPWDRLESDSGLSRVDMLKFARDYSEVRTAIFIWSMGLTQHRFGTENVEAVVNLALARGMVGREHTGVVPIRGHSGVQGAGECGVGPGILPGGVPMTDDHLRRFEDLWGTRISGNPGHTAGPMLAASRNGEFDVLYNVGGNLLDTMPDPKAAAESLARVKLRIHQDIVLNTSTLLDCDGDVIVLPAQTRYEQRTGGTETTTERRIRFSPEIPGPRIGEARPEWEIPCQLAHRVLADGKRLFPYTDTSDIRREMAEAIPKYEGIQALRKAGDSVQWGGRILVRGGVCDNLPDGRARFADVEPPRRDLPADGFWIHTRRGKQFNSIVQSDLDPLVGNATRDAIFMSDEDIRRLGLSPGTPVLLRSSHGTFRGHVHPGPIRPRNLQAYWPEANVLLPTILDPLSEEPEYGTVVTVEPA